MSIAVSWLDDTHRIISLVVKDPWTYGEIGGAMDVINTMTKDRTDPFTILSDMSQSEKTVRLELAEFRRLAQHPVFQHHRISRAHVGGIKMSVKVLYDMAAPFFPRLFKIAKLYNSTEIALADLTAYLAEQDTSRP